MHKCVRCGSLYEDNDSSILRGCKCGSIFFLLMRTPQDAQEIKDIQQELETKETTLEQEITKKIEETKYAVIEKAKEEMEPVVVARKKRPKVMEKVKRERKKFGIETLKIPREGVYEINIDALMKKRPLIILERGRVYIIHLPSAFEIEK